MSCAAVKCNNKLLNAYKILYALKMATIIVSSAKANVANSRPDNFSMQLPKPLILKGGGNVWEVAQITGSAYRSNQNVRGATLTGRLSTNYFRYFTGSSWEDVIIQPGIYSVLQISNYVKALMKERFHYIPADPPTTPNEEYYIYFGVNLIENKVFVYIKPDSGYQIDFSVSDINKLLGFEKVILTASASSTTRPDINDGVDALVIHSNLTNASIFNDNDRADVMGVYTMGSAPPQGLIDLTPRTPLYVPIASETIYSIQCYITDQDGRPVDFNNEPVSLTFHIRKRQL